MENLQQKAHFLRHEYADILSNMDAAAPRKWGKLNVQQMIEHMSEYIGIASGRVPMQTITPEEHIPRMQSFLASEKDFKENTPNTLMPDEPAPAKHASISDSVNELRAAIEHFFIAHENEPGKRTANPFFGSLNFDQQVQLLHKHAMHHLRQFGVVE